MFYRNEQGDAYSVQQAANFEKFWISKPSILDINHNGNLPFGADNRAE